MDFVSVFLAGQSSDTHWLLAANIVLLLVLVLALGFHRRRYRVALSEQVNGAALIENLHEGVYRSSLDGRQLRANRSLVRLNGYKNEAEMLQAVNNIATEWYVDPTRRDKFRAILHREGQVEDFISEVFRHKTRERIWITESARIVYHPTTGKPQFYEGSVREITETVKRLRLEEQFQKLTSQLPGGLFQFRRDQSGSYTVVYLSGGFRRIIGVPDDTAFATPARFIELVLAEDTAEFFRSLVRSRRNLGAWDHEFRLRMPSGEIKWLRVMAKAEKSDNAITWHGYLVDISARKKQDMEIEKLAYFDPLTGLPNRRLLMDRTTTVLGNCAGHGRAGALLFIDLDNFKTLNDGQGHHVGDQYLVQVAERLQGCVGENATVSRMGGDEFVILLDNIGPDQSRSTDQAMAAAHEVLDALKKDFVLGPVHHRGSASIGVAVFNGSEETAEELVRRADIAMYQAKAGGRNGVALFDPASLEMESQRFQLLNHLRTAIAGNELVLNFQPQINREGLVCGAEGLLRWQHEKLGDIPPSLFIPLAEYCGLIHEIDALVVASGIATLARWQARPETSQLRLALNISVQSFANTAFVPRLKELVAEYNVDASSLTLEFAENVMARNQALTASQMAELKEIGIRFSLDDFGTGYSSLAHLKKLPFDEVKIDGGFVADIETRESDRALVRTILAMATTLGLTAVAEHVENDKQRIFLHLFGCEIFQGFLYSPAVPESDFLAFAAAHNGRPSIKGTTDIRQQA